MLFDRRTYRFLGSRRIAVPPADGKTLTSPSPGETPIRIPRGGPPAGTVRSAFALLKVDVANHLPAH